MSKKIMISYGRKDATGFVHKINDILVKLGHTVWIDRSKEENNGIDGGKKWEEEIEKAIETHEIVLAILSPHAIRRSNGVCLDEISMARFENKFIIPLMYKEVKPPLCIFRLDWIDFLKSETETSVMEVALEKLLRSIDNNKLDYEGKNKAFRALKSINFDSRLTGLKQDFVGREWIFDANDFGGDSLIDKWLMGDKKVMLILGNPGIGKSAISAHLIEKHPRCLAYHFCIADDEETLDPNKFIRSIAHQLTTQLGDEYRDKVLETIDELPNSPVSLFRTLISNPISQLQNNSDEKYFILVDGLDEASRYKSTNELLKLFSNSFVEALPDHIRFIFTSRDDANIVSRFEAEKSFKIETTDDRNTNDMKKYLNKMIVKYDIKKLNDYDIKTILDKSEGSILYLKQVIKIAKDRHTKVIDVENLPKGLFGIYDEEFDMTFSNDEYNKEYRDILEVLVALYSPIDKILLEIILDKDNLQLNKISAHFPTDGEKKIKVFHKSFSDWLSDGKVWSVNVVKGHKRIINTKKLRLDDQGELRIYLFSATKIFIYKQIKRDEDVSEFFDTSIIEQLKKLSCTNENRIFISKLEKLLEDNNEDNIKYKKKLESLFAQEKNSASVSKLKKLVEEDSDKWNEDYLVELDNLAMSHEDNNQLTEVIELQKKSVEVTNILYKENPIKWVEGFTKALDSLANSYLNQKRITEAIELNEEALSIIKVPYKENPARWVEDYIKSLNNLANSYRIQNRLNETIELEEEVLSIIKVLYKENPARWVEAYPKALNSLANSYNDHSYLEKAMKLHLEALEIIKVLYKENPSRWSEDYTRSVNNLSHLYKDLDHFDESIELEEEALEIMKVFYKENPARWSEDYTILLENLANSYYEDGYLDEAMKLYLESLEITKVFNKENPTKWSKEDEMILEELAYFKD